MLNFRNTNIIFIALLLLLAVAHVFFHVPLFIYLLLFVTYSLILFRGCYYIGSNFFIHIVCSGTPFKRQIAISFDDGPVESSTPDLLKLLQEYRVEAAFFCIGNRIAGNENLLTQIHEEGHLVGNHSYSHHFWFDMYSTSKMTRDLKMMDEEVKRVIGLTPKLFRPPYGVTNPNVKGAVVNGGYTPVGWSVRSMDTVIKDERKLLSKMNSSLKPGAIFLFHDTSKTTLNILPEFIRKARKEGYEIIRLDKMLNLQPYA